MAAREAAPEELIDRFRELHAELERMEDPRARAGCEELIAVVLDLYGEGLRRIIAALEDAGEPAAGLRERLADDGVVASLMLIHDLYPVPLAERVGEALDSVRPYMESHGGDVELLAVEGGVARIRLSGSCDGCPASASTLELAIKQALDARAPDLDALEVEGGVASPGIDAADDGMELPVVQAPAANGAAAGPVSADAGATDAPIGLPSWFGIDGVAGLADGELTAIAAAGLPLVVANVDGKLLAYRDACAGCGGPLEHAVGEDGAGGAFARRSAPPARAGPAAARERRGPGGSRDVNGQADLVGGLRRLAGRSGATTTVAGDVMAAGEERCELCGAGLPTDHRHLIDLDDRRLLCACETCWSVRSGEPRFRPAGARTEWLGDFDLPDEAWASFAIPVGLAFFLRTGEPERVFALYPSPAGATESEIDPDAWERLQELNPALDRLEPDSEALIVNRMSEPHQHAVVPIDECYRLVGMIKSSWEGISGGPGPEEAIGRFFAELRVKAATGGELRGFGGDV